MGKPHTPDTAACDVEAPPKRIEGRWKLLLFHLFDGKVQRYSDLERMIPAILQKMLAQQLRQLERDGLVLRTVYSQVPPQVDYRLTPWGLALCPALNEFLDFVSSSTTQFLSRY
ncbi:helix-turn-helix domain-containing protein [Xanthomonas campestris pv. raphani]|uniref:winged helix-turn-helix transcriptional regulator n=1 Tax=Xanthomonas campestris TaxID=339 RepID=UPI0023E9569B|nr:helix-turn-helix domain-containing protein [Xanthomonas campestris]MCW2038201.1 DNA-binding HxlR family transcriptional regulator [Xanthomonas campestris]MEA9827418.1 helix-turn-helix domain-containing protein [Xanthomonas campestris pv. raphani]